MVSLRKKFGMSAPASMEGSSAPGFTIVSSRPCGDTPANS
jgi:hypothetical protein